MSAVLAVVVVCAGCPGSMSLIAVLFLMSVSVVCGGNPVGSCANPPTVLDTGTARISTQIEAQTRVRNIIGASETTALRMSTERVTIRNDKTPYLSQELIGRELWVVKVHNWVLKSSAPTAVRGNSTREMTLYVIPETGVVVKVWSPWLKGIPPLPPIVEADVAAAQMASGAEIYHGFPDQGPSISLEKALDAIHARGFDPRDAREIIAEYVVWSRMGEPSRPVWAVMLRGVPVIKPPPGTPAGALDQYRHIVDAETGEWLWASNLPRWVASKTPEVE